MTIFTRAFWVDAVERSVATAAEAAAATFVVDRMSAFSVDWKQLAGIALGAALAALLKAIAKSARTTE